MGFLADVEELKSGLIIFRRTDVQHKNWYCRIRVPESDKYKTISLKTPDIREARDKAFDADADIRFRIKHDVPVFEKSFSEVATEYGNYKKKLADAGQISMERWRIIDSHIRLHLIPYAGHLQITRVGQNEWEGYPFWRKQNGSSRDSKTIRQEKTADKQPVKPVKDDTIRAEMIVFRSIMKFAADANLIKERQIPKGKIALEKGRREEFTPQEYRHLHTYARQWIKEGHSEWHRWHRIMAYNFMLIMANTGMRTMEARNLRWRDIDPGRIDRQGRPFVALNVRGKKKFRELVAANNVAVYFERIKAVSQATKPDDFVFTTYKGKQCIQLYSEVIESLLTKSKLLFSSSGSRRSSYCFRHTYATFRLMEGIDVYFLAKQMGTSVKMIEDYYGHITPTKNAERILDGIPGWQPMAEDDGGKTDGVNAAPAAPKAKPRTKKDK